MASVEIDGGVELRNALNSFTPFLARRLEKQMETALIPIVTKARGFLPVEAPLSTWQLYSVQRIGRFPHYNALAIARGIVIDTKPSKPNKKGWAYAASIKNTTAAGAIYETAGRKNKNGRKPAPKGEKSRKFSQSANPNAGQQFIQSLGPLYKVQRAKGQSGRVSRKMNGRLIYRAWGEDQGKALGAVNKAIDDSIREFHSKTFNLFKTVKAG